jgi:MFS family permease
MGISGGAVSALGYTLGPVLGGLLTYALGWRSNLYLSAALAFVGLAAARHLLPPESFEASSVRKEPFDFPGAITFSLGISLFLLALATAQKSTWWSPLIGIELLGAIAVLGLFVWLERRARFLLLDLALFRIPAFTLGNTTRWISFVTMSINILLMPFFLQLGMGLDPLQAGFLVMPTPLAMALLASLTGWMSERFVPERLCSLGSIINAVASLGLSFLSAESASLTIVWWLSVLGFGMGLFQTPKQQLIDELPSAPVPGSRIVFLVDCPQPGQLGGSRLGGDHCRRATASGNRAHFAAKSWGTSRNGRWSTGARCVPAALSLHLFNGSGTLFGGRCAQRGSRVQ